jgi:Domain of unknown function (DUF4383)
MNGDRSSPSMLYAGVAGAVLVLVGIIGFFYNATFTSDESVRDAVFGILDVNGWHNVLHVMTGVLGLLAFSAGAYTARTYAMAVGLLYLAVAVWGFMVGSGDSILSIIPVNTEDNILHLLVGVAGVGAALATPAEARASAPPAAA